MPVHDGPRQQFGEFLVDLADERLIGPDGPVRIGNKAYKVLVRLIDQQGLLLTKDALFSSVWDGTFVSESSLTTVVKELRRALGDDPRQPRYIESVYGRGYRLIPPVRAVGAPEPSAEQPPSGEAPPLPAPPPAAPLEDADLPPLVVVSAFGDVAIHDVHPFLAQELREEVLSALARVREIQLVSDDGEAPLPRHAGRAYQLTATLLPEGAGAKVVARAKRLGDGRVVWAETMSLLEAGTAGGVDRIVRRILGAAMPALDDDVLGALPRGADAFYDRYLLAKRQSLQARDYAEARAAADALQRIVDDRPEFGLAYPPLVRLYNTDFGYTALGATGDGELERALSLARRGLAADRSNAHAHCVLGWCFLRRHEHGMARACFDQVLRLNPYNHVRLQEVAAGSMFLGELEDARRLLERAAELNPHQDDNYYEDLGRLLLLEGDLPGARAALQAVMHDSIWADLYLAACEIGLGDPAGRERIARWRDRARARWHGDAPDAAALLAWVRRHNPFPADGGKALFAPLARALAD